MNWGNKLVIVFVAFTVLIGTLVYKAINAQYDLVSEEYYQDELKYEDHITAVKNTTKLSSVTIQQNAGSIIVTLPKEMNGYKVDGNAWFYYKTNAANDRKQVFSTSDGTTSFTKQGLPKGNVLLKLNWKSGNEDYYVEKIISL
ncbi:hypothetical protein BH10BAC2_BH10BAC2_40420 [soil metagenome]